MRQLNVESRTSTSAKYRAPTEGDVGEAEETKETKETKEPVSEAEEPAGRSSILW